MKKGKKANKVYARLAKNAKNAVARIRLDWKAIHHSLKIIPLRSSIEVTDGFWPPSKVHFLLHFRRIPGFLC